MVTVLASTATVRGFKSGSSRLSIAVYYVTGVIFWTATESWSLSSLNCGRYIVISKLEGSSVSCCGLCAGGFGELDGR